MVAAEQQNAADPADRVGSGIGVNRAGRLILDVMPQSGVSPKYPTSK
jgi:hypothetical protein